MSDITGDRPVDLAASLQDLVEESQALRSDVAARETRQRAEARIKERRTRMAIIAVAVGLVIAIALTSIVVVLLVQSRQRGAETRKLIRGSTEVSQQIADCTTAGRPCYERGAKRSQALIAALMKNQVDVALCQDTTDTPAELKVCSEQALSRNLAAMTPAT